MKKILSIMLALTLVLALTACGGKEKPVVNDDVTIEEETVAPDEELEAETEEEKAEDKKDEIESQSKPENKPAENKPSENKPAENKPAENKPAENKPAENKPAENKPAENKPTESKPQESKPETEKAPATLGNTLLADFKGKANSGMSTLEIAEGLMQNEAIKFMGGAMEVEPGLLSGFDNTEITGFKSGAVFMPMIGSIAFVGYVFELENAADTGAFISKLKSSANMRWNICVEAEEMVTGSVGNKVFFVMCPKTLEE